MFFLAPDQTSALKVHERAEGYTTEVEAYNYLKHLGIAKLHGLTLPRIHHWRDDLQVIRMDCVKAPYLLDFAGVRFDPPDFTQEGMEDWHRNISFRFGNNAWIAHLVYDSLSKHELFYLDFRPSNMKLDGLPGLSPDSETDDDAF